TDAPISYAMFEQRPFAEEIYKCGALHTQLQIQKGRQQIMMTINSKTRQFTAKLRYSTAAFALAAVCGSPILPPEPHPHAALADDQNAANTLLSVVRTATAKYKDVAVAQRDGYALQFGCVTGSDAGAMGLHYVNSNLVNSGVLDPMHPQIVIYEQL